MQKTLFIVYDVHKTVDIISERLGLTKENLKAYSIYLSGAARDETRQTVDRAVDAFYDSIEPRLLEAGITQVYQDGSFLDMEKLASEYPNKYQSLIADIRALAELGSRSSGLVMRLYDQGSSLEKTEDLELVREEAELISGFAELAKLRATLDLDALSPEQETYFFGLAKRVRSLQATQPKRAEERDQVITQNINSGLRGTGLLIIGAMHYGIAQYLAGDIEQVELMPEGLVIQRGR